MRPSADQDSVRQVRIEDTLEKHRKKPPGALADAMSTLLDSAEARAAEAEVEGSIPSAGNHFEADVFQHVRRATEMDDSSGEDELAAPAAALEPRKAAPGRRRQSRAAAGTVPKAAGACCRLLGRSASGSPGQLC